MSSTDAQSRITRLKDGRTHLAYKAEHVVDLECDLVLAAEIYEADRADTLMLVDSVMAAQGHLHEECRSMPIKEVVADKGYHAAATLELADGFVYDSLREHAEALGMADYRKWILEGFNGTLCVDELHLGRFTLLLAIDPLRDRPVAFALGGRNDADHM